MNKEKLIAEIGKGINSNDSGDWVRKSTVYGIINKALEGYSIVPDDDYLFLLDRVNCYCQEDAISEYWNNNSCAICNLKMNYKAMLEANKESEQ